MRELEKRNWIKGKRKRQRSRNRHEIGESDKTTKAVPIFSAK
jgi:hypothetical protein